MPFLSGADLRALQKQLEVALAQADWFRAALADRTQQHTVATQRIAELTDTLVALKRQGYTPPDPVPVPIVREPLSAVDAAVQALPPRYQGGVRREMVKWKLEGLSEAAIARRIEVGEEVWATESAYTALRTREPQETT